MINYNAVKEFMKGQTNVHSEMQSKSGYIEKGE